MQESCEKLCLVPRPQEVRLLGGYFILPERPIISYGPASPEMRFAAETLATTLKSIHKEAVLQPGMDGIAGCWLIISDAPSNPSASDFPSDDESYRIGVTDHAEILAGSPQVAFYGAQTLSQAIIATQGILPRLEIVDQPKLQMRGLMVDLGRLKEKDEYYRKLIDFMAQHRMNTLFMHLADDEGAPILFKSHPKLAGPYALTRESIKKLVDYAAERHIDIIPEIEVWGHAGWVTNHPHYADIAEGGPDLCTTNPRTWSFIGDLLDEVCQMFPSQYVHGGCDEAIFGLCPTCKAEVEKHGKDHLVGLHLKRVAEMIHERGRTPILWGDILLKYPDSVEVVPKYTIINHWDYSADPSEEPVKLLQSKGFVVLAAPALVCAGRAVLPLDLSLQNVAKTGGIAGKYNLMGINNTIWAPQRVIADTLWPAIALAAEASWTGSEPHRDDLTKRFFKNFFGIDAGDDLLEALRVLHSIPVDVGMHVDGMWRNKEEFLESADLEDLEKQEDYLSSIQQALKTFRSYRRKVTRQKWEYGALVHAVEMKKHICDRRLFAKRCVLVLAARKTKGFVPPITFLPVLTMILQALVKEEKRLYRLTEPYWDKWRYKDDPKKTYSAENILEAFRSSDSYMQALYERLQQAADMLEKGEEPDWDALIPDE
jgi:hypothetical protein